MNQSNESAPRNLLIPVKSGYHIIQSHEIMLLEADSNYCHIHLEDGTKYLVSRTLKSVAEQLRTSAFVRVHKSFLVNLHFVTRIQTGKTMNVHLANGMDVLVARSQRVNLIHHLQNICQA